MQCPVCGTPLRAIEKFGVEIDICPGCKGVWLDRGELEKITAMASAGGPAASQPLAGSPGEYRRDERTRHTDTPRYRDDDDDDDDRFRRPTVDQHGRPLRKKRGSWLAELFEGFGGDD